MVFLLGAALSALCQQQASETVAFWPEKGNPPVKGFAQDLDHRQPQDSLFFRQKMALQKKRFFEVFFLLLPLALGEFSRANI